VCDHAAWAATQLETPVELLHVMEKHASNPKIAPDRSGRLGVDSREALLKQLVDLDSERNKIEQQVGRHLLDEAAAEVRKGGVSEIRQRLVHGEVVDQLTDHEAEASLIVLGRRGEAEEQGGQHLGRNIERVIRASHRPIVVVGQAYRPINRFLLSYDGGFTSERAISYLLKEPLLREAQGHLLTVGDGTENERERLRHTGERLSKAGYTITESIQSGDPDHLIPEVAETEGLDLILMGAYGHSHVRNLIIGSTTTAVLRTSPVSVLVVR
jgi:nucleotide-binding universal stress UspA family protein